MLESWDVAVTQEPDGNIVIWQRVRRSDGSGGEGRGWGPCPTVDQPLRGPVSFDPGVGIVHTVAANVDRVAVRLSDGSDHSPSLRDVEGAEDARWFCHKVPDPQVSPVMLTAYAADGVEVGRMDFRRSDG